jgi:Ca2+-binding EF-hand superfamily protein
MTFDVDGSGQLDKAECQRLCRYMNYPNREADVERMFEAVGASESGKLNLEEFMSYMQNKRPKPELLYGLDKRQYEAFILIGYLCLRRGFVPS